MKENSIEEAIERLEYIDRTYSCNNYYSIWDLKCIEILLSDYKRVLKENERISSENGIGKRQYEELVDDYEKLNLENIELKKENEELKEDRDKFKKALGRRITYCNELEKDLFENSSNYVIKKQKVKEKIEELNNVNNAEALEDLMNTKNYTITQLVQYVLQELLGKE